MSRLRRYLVPALLLAAVTFICGKLLLTPVTREVTEWEINQIRFSVAGPAFVYQYGWPWVFSERNEPIGDCEYSTFSLKWLIGDVVILASAIAVIAVFLAGHRHRHGRWLRISLRELMASIAVFATGMGLWMYHDHLGQRELIIVDQLRLHGINFQVAYCGPEWLRRLIPWNYLNVFQHVVNLSTSGAALTWKMSPDNRREFSNALQQMPYVSGLVFNVDDFEWLLNMPENPSRSSVFEPAGDPDAEIPRWLESIDLSAFKRIEDIEFKPYFVDDRILMVVAKLPQIRRILRGRSVHNRSRSQVSCKLYALGVSGSRENSYK